MGKPTIRFKGYTDDWEQRKLGELASSFEYGLNAAAKEYDGENKYIRITDIDDNTHEFLTDNLTSPDIELTGADNYKLTEGDILFARTGASAGKSYIYKNSDGLVYYAGFLIRARIKEEYDAEFVFQNTLTDRYNKYIAVTSQRSGQPGVNAQEYAEFEIKVPQKEEQTKIGTYFHNIDHLITLHQRKCDQAKILKKYMLQKMFPQNDEKVPKIRFKGFTDDWEQRKLDDLTEELSEYATMASGLPLLTSSRSGLMYQSDFRDRKTTTSDETLFSIVPKGSCTYRHMSDDDIFHMNINVLEKGLVSREYPVFISSENNDLEFIIQHINSSDRFRAFCKGQKKGGTRTRLYYKTLCEFEMMIPSIEEQKKISATLHSLDHLITLHQHKCEELKNIKKFMLQNMFVQEK